MKFKPLSVLIQYFLPHQWATRCVHTFMHCRQPWIKRKIIQAYIRNYKVNMKEALIENPDAYASFNDFFTRALKPTVRSIPKEGKHWISPVDGTISQLGDITQGQLIQAKNHYYHVLTLLGNELSLAREFSEGSFMTIYLAPKDYHRVHIPMDGVLEHMIYVPGRLFSVNPTSAQHIPELFARNERVCCIFSNKDELFAVIFVGAFIVGSIATTWHGTVNSNALRNQPFYFNYSKESLSFTAGDEIGRFMMGSTVILLSSKKKHWKSNLKPSSVIRLGEYLTD